MDIQLPEKILEALRSQAPAGKVWIGYSGGADSTALLHAAASIRELLNAPLHALHFHHGLQTEADAWLDHCQAFCKQLDVEFHAVHLNLASQPDGNLEAMAREARYAVIEKRLGKGEIYLTAHHRDDQAETLLLNLMRGSGLQGIAGIPSSRPLGAGRLVRPFLDVSRQQLLDYLQGEQISWVNDLSNNDDRFDRNFLRNTVLPQLESRWPGAARRLSRTAGHARDLMENVSHLLEQSHAELLEGIATLSLVALISESPGIRPLLVREWLRRRGYTMMPTARLEEWLKQVQQARKGEVRWAGQVLYAYHDWLWLYREEDETPCPDRVWERSSELTLGPVHGSLALVPLQEGALTPAAIEAVIPEGTRVRTRLASDRIRIQSNRPRRKSKALFQAAGTPPRLRPTVPLLVIDEIPVALGDWCIDHRFSEQLESHGLQLEWRPASPVLQDLRQLAVDRYRGLG